MGASGDALLAEFPSAIEAVTCAIDIQRELAGRNAALPEHRRMRFRIRVNLGDVTEQDGALYGDGVNIAARVQTIAAPGSICVSEAVYQQVYTKLDLAFDDLGECEVKNIAAPVGVYRVGEPGQRMTPRPAESGQVVPLTDDRRRLRVRASAEDRA